MPRWTIWTEPTVNDAQHPILAATKQSELSEQKLLLLRETKDLLVSQAQTRDKERLHAYEYRVATYRGYTNVGNKR